MDIAVSGSSGLIGTALIAELQRQGHRTIRLVRPGRALGPGDLGWDPQAGVVDAEGLEGIDGLVHLAGVPIGGGRWTDTFKESIIRSRVVGTDLLARTVVALRTPPRVFASASAAGYYGDRGEEILTEASVPGSGFPAEVAVAWEDATDAVKGSDVRLVILRSASVLSTHGGVLPYMLTPFRLGLGAKFGDGSQWFPWISLRDEVGAIIHALTRREVEGPANLCAPAPTRNADFTKALGRALHRPTPWRAPKFALNVIAGKERAREVLLGSQRIDPAVLNATGYVFEDPEVTPALERIVGSAD